METWNDYSTLKSLNAYQESYFCNLFRGLESLSMLLTYCLLRKSEPLTSELVSYILLANELLNQAWVLYRVTKMLTLGI